MSEMTVTFGRAAAPLRARGLTVNERGSVGQAVRALRSAARKGDCEAQCNQGDPCRSGLGDSRHDAEALRWLLRACARGDREAQFQVGQLYASRARTPEDLVEAYKWYSLAAEQGVPVGPEPFEALELRMTDEEVRKALELASDCRLCRE
jgi:uncharacterized protein